MSKPWQFNTYLERILYTSVLVAFVALVAVSGWHIYQWITVVQDRLADLEGQIAKQQDVARQTQAQLVAVIGQNQQLQQRLLEAKQRDSRTQEAIAETQQQFSSQLNQLQSDVQSKVGEEAISDLIGQWQHRVAQITCQLRNQDEKGVSRGSAVALMRSGEVQFVTNRHIVAQDGYSLDGCRLELPESNESYTVRADSVETTDDLDLAYVDINESPSHGVQNAAQISQCATKPQIGQRVVILGYPQVGADKGITATEGIISGFSNPYYITSAKIEQGNSGGAAINVQDNCFLGMPTLSVAGRLESLARILPAPEI